MNILEIQNLQFSYAPYDDGVAAIEREKQILNIDSISIQEGSFVVLCGANGSGKSTLLRLIKSEIAPAGDLTGQILWDGKRLEEIEEKQRAFEIGYVAQNPEHSAVTDKVWHELAFGLENLGVPSQEIRRRVAELAAFFGMEEWYEREIATLSGGQKQILALASVLAMRPRLLLLDEPISQLDPIAAGEFLQILRKCNHELGITILMAEHRMDELIPMCDRLVVLEQGRIIYDGTPVNAAMPQQLWRSMPCASQLNLELTNLSSDMKRKKKEIQLSCNNFAEKEYQTIAVARRNLRELLQIFGEDKITCDICEAAVPSANQKLLSWKHIDYSYDGKKDVLRDFQVELFASEIFCILGGNGSGKSTACKLLAGILPMQGSRQQKKESKELQQHIAYLPQDVETCFLYETVREEIGDAEWFLSYDFTPLLGRHPYDLSGGEKQLVALEKVLRKGCRILLLDEPAKGLDASARDFLCKTLTELKSRGLSILIVTHDVEFAAECGDRCGLFFRGEIIATEPTRDFMRHNTIYTTQAVRISQGMLEDLITTDELIRCLERVVTDDR